MNRTRSFGLKHQCGRCCVGHQAIGHPGFAFVIRQVFCLDVNDTTEVFFECEAALIIRNSYPFRIFGNNGNVYAGCLFGQIVPKILSVADVVIYISRYCNMLEEQTKGKLFQCCSRLDALLVYLDIHQSGRRGIKLNGPYMLFVGVTAVITLFAIVLDGLVIGDKLQSINAVSSQTYLSGCRAAPFPCCPNTGSCLIFGCIGQYPLCAHGSMVCFFRLRQSDLQCQRFVVPTVVTGLCLFIAILIVQLYVSIGEFCRLGLLYKNLIIRALHTFCVYAFIDLIYCRIFNEAAICVKGCTDQGLKGIGRIGIFRDGHDIFFIAINMDPIPSAAVINAVPIGYGRSYSHYTEGEGYIFICPFTLPQVLTFIFYSRVTFMRIIGLLYNKLGDTVLNLQHSGGFGAAGMTDFVDHAHFDLVYSAFLGDIAALILLSVQLAGNFGIKTNSLPANNLHLFGIQILIRIVVVYLDSVDTGNGILHGIVHPCASIPLAVIGYCIEVLCKVVFYIPIGVITTNISLSGNNLAAVDSQREFFGIGQVDDNAVGSHGGYVSGTVSKAQEVQPYEIACIVEHTVGIIYADPVALFAKFFPIYI